MLVVTRLRAPGPDRVDGEELRRGLLQALDILAAKPGYVGGEVGRNVDDPALWVLTTRWQNVGSYRRALGSYEGKMHIQPLHGPRARRAQCLRGGRGGDRPQRARSLDR